MGKHVRLSCRRVALLVVALVSVLAASPARADSRGTDFWVAFLSNFDNGVTFPLTPTLFISAEAAATGTVEVPGIGFSQTFTVPAGGVATVTFATLPTTTNSVVAGTGGTISTEPLGIHITSNTEVTVYGFSYSQQVTDGYLALPVDVLGTQYRVLSYSGTLLQGGGGNPSELGVVATVDGTSVTVTPTADLVGGTTAGTPVVRTLNAGDVLFVPSVIGGDLTGSTVTSSQPVTVFGADNCVYVPSDMFSCNHLVEQLPPTSAWGSDFVTVPLAARMGGDRIRVLSNTAGTSVSINGTVMASSLAAGAFYEQVVTGPTHITASQPVLVGYFAQGQGVDLALVGDPTFFLVPPTTQLLTSYIFNSSDKFNPNFVNVAVPTAAVSSLTLDGTAVGALPTPPTFTALAGTSFSNAQIPLTAGAHRLAASSAFAAYVYGYATADNYGFAAGGNYPVQQTGVASLSLAPASQAVTIGQQACVNATLLNAQGQPQAGASIAFAVTGVNTASGSVNTGTNGVAQFCYSGTNAGQDTVTATSGTLHPTATVTWSQPTGNSPPVVNAGADKSGVEGSAVQLNGTATDTDPLTTTWTATPGAGVDAGASCSFANAPALSTTVTCNDDGSWTITLTASDGVNPPVSDSLTLTVTNANPRVTITLPVDNGVVQPGASVSVIATLQDPGSHDTLTCAIDWGDGTSGAGSLTNGVCTGQHAYGAVGTFTLTVQATDDDGGRGSASVHVVVQQAAARSKLLGLGTIEIKDPYRYVVRDSTLFFEFFASSNGGQLNGELFARAGGNTFLSTKVTSLSVNGTHATWSGTGRVNGNPGYTFTASIEDNQTGNYTHSWARDRFAITIKDHWGNTVFEASGSLKSGFVSVR